MRDQIGRQTNKPHNRIEYKQNNILHGAETRRLRKIVQRNRDKALSRRANAVLLVLQGKARMELPCRRATQQNRPDNFFRLNEQKLRAVYQPDEQAETAVPASQNDYAGGG